MKKNLLFVITHSLGELDVILPITSKVIDNYNVVIVFTVQSLYEDFKANIFYISILDYLNVTHLSIVLPNKFDSMSLVDRFPFSRLLKAFFYKFRFPPIRLIYLGYLIFKSSAVLHEHSCQYSAVQFLYFFTNIFNKKVFVYLHGHAANIHTNQKQIKFCPSRSIFLCFHDHSSEVYHHAGYKNQIIIGYPKFYPEWTNLIKIRFGSNMFGRTYVVLFTRKVHEYYMNPSVYSKLLLDSCRVINAKYDSNILIVIKPHPREGDEEIRRILRNNNINNFVVSRLDSSVLSLNAELTISFWTSAILSSLALGVPSVEYYIESEKFRVIEPSGSAYKFLGIHSVSDEFGLVDFVDSVISHSYTPPKIAQELVGNLTPTIFN
jgi:hypothetical protein